MKKALHLRIGKSTEVFFRKVEHSTSYWYKQKLNLIKNGKHNSKSSSSKTRKGKR